MSKFNIPREEAERKQINNFIESLKDVRWFSPSQYLKKEGVDKLAHVVIKSFGIKAELEYRPLETNKDWRNARLVDWGSTWCHSLNTTINNTIRTATTTAFNCAKDSLYHIDKGDAYSIAVKTGLIAGGAASEITSTNKTDKKFTHLYKLWDIGLYPAGVEDGKFIIYVPPCRQELPFKFKKI